VTSGGHDVTDACKLDGTALVLNADATVLVGEDKIPVRPALADSGEEIEPFVVGDDAAVGVKTIPGLTYRLVRGTEPDAVDTPIGEAVRATAARTELRDDAKPAGKAFYRIRAAK